MQATTYVYSEGSSHKFWAVGTLGSTVVTRWGRVGTAGQEKARACADDAEASALADRLRAEKLRKGYVPDGTATTLGTEAAPVEAPTPPEVPAAAPSPALVQLTEQELALPSWRPLAPAPERSAGPVDLDAVAARLRTIEVQYGWWRFAGRVVPDDVSPLEASMWLRMATPGRRSPRDAFAEARKQLDVVLEPTEVDELAAETQLPDVDALPAVLAVLGPRAVASRLVAALGRDDGYRGPSSWATRARTLLLPSLDEAERDALRAAVAAHLRPLLGHPDRAHGLAVTLGAALGFHDELDTIVSSWSAGYLDQSYHPDHSITELLGLGSAERFVEEVERLGLAPSSELGVVAWLAVTGTERLDRLGTSLVLAPNRSDATRTATAVFSRVHAPELAPVALAALGSRAPQLARAWLDAHPAEATVGLAPLLARRGTLAEDATDELRRLARGPGRDAMVEASADLEPADLRRLEGAVLEAGSAAAAPVLTGTPPWLEADDLGRGRLPSWLDPASLPALLVDGGTLRDEDVTTVLRALKASGEERHPVVDHLRAHGLAVTNDAFAWSLLQTWLAAGAPSRDGWALLAVGHLGGDRSAHRLTPLVRAWPGESAHARAKVGLRALRAMGTDTALSHLNGIAQKIRYKALQAAAREAMDDIAAERGLTRPELEDRIVPDAGLDADGTRTFDYGPRQFHFVLGPGMKPMLRDAAGKLRTSAPPPGARDDQARATAAREEWRLLRKVVADTAKLQAARLEDAMITQRAWSVDDFEQRMAGHPLLRHLVRLLVLLAQGPDGTRRSFRLTEEGELADADDRPFALRDDDRILIAHPLELPAPELAAWGQLLADDELVQPFAQLGRPVHDLPPDRLGDREVRDLPRRRLPAATFVGLLERAGWERGPVEDAGIYHEHTRTFDAAGVVAVIEYDGVPVGMLQDWDPQAVDRCWVRRIDDGGPWWARRGARAGALRWGDVPPIVRSEVLATLAALEARAG